MVLTRMPPPDPPLRDPCILHVNVITQKRQKRLISNFLDTFHTPMGMKPVKNEYCWIAEMAAILDIV